MPTLAGCTTARLTGMSASVATDEPSPHPSSPASQRPPLALDPPPTAVPRPSPREVVAGVCPYLASAGGSWRSAVPSRDHRCTAVDPAAPQTTEKQRRHCLSPAHEDCSLFRAARAARVTSLAAGLNPAAIEAADRRRRAIARTAPIVLEPPRFVDQAIRFQLDQAPGQVALIALMVVAFAVVAIARFSGPSGDSGGSPSASVVAVASPSPRPRPTPSPTASPSVEPSGSPAPSFRTTYTVKRNDTLSSIATKFKTTAAKIKALNGLTSNALKVGQVLKIP